MTNTPEFRNLVREFVYTTFFYRLDLDFNGMLKTVANAMDAYDVSPLTVANSFRQISNEFIDKYKLEPWDVVNLTSVFGNLDIVMQAYDSVASSGQFHSATWQPDRTWLLDVPDTKITVTRIISSLPSSTPAADSVSIATPAPVPAPVTVSTPTLDYTPPTVPVTVQPTPVVDKNSAVVQLLEKPGYWLGDLFVIDLNQDGVDEVIVAGRLSHPATVTSWLDSYVSVLGFNTGTWSNETNHWFGSDEVKILGTEPSVRIGDFDGDSNVDVWIAPSTDMEHYGPGTVFFNDGDSLIRRDIDIGKVWAHDSAVIDINNDGFDDIILSSYGPDQTVAFGRADREFDVVTQPAVYKYSGIAAADFLNNGSASFVMVDTWGDGISDTALFAFTSTPGYTGISSGAIASSENINLQQIKVLPGDRFELTKWDTMTWLDQPGRMPHSVRATPFDFDRDGLIDVLVSTSANNAADQWHSYFEMQFLRNLGNGLFQDRTDDVLINWDAFTTVSYNPVVRDINGDGLDDVWLSSQDYNGTQNSNRMLLAQPDGTFVQAWQQELARIQDELEGLPSPLAWIQGPDQPYLAGMIWTNESTQAEIKLISEIPLSYI